MKKHSTYSSLNLVFHSRYFPENSCLALRGNGLQTYICRDLSDMKDTVQKSCISFKVFSWKFMSGTSWQWPTDVYLVEVCLTWMAVYKKNTARYLPYLVVYLRDYPENQYLAQGDSGLQKFYVWSQSIYNKVQFTALSMLFYCILKVHIWQYVTIANKGCMFGSDWSVMICSLHDEHSTFSVLHLFPLNSYCNPKADLWRQY